MPDSSRSVVVRLSLDTAQALASSKEFGREVTAGLNQAETAAKRTGAAVDDLGNKAGRLALGGAAALGAIAKVAVDWESAWAGVTKTVDGTAEEMAQLEGELRSLARTLPATHDEIAGVAEAAGQLGVAREDITEFTRTMVALGETTNLTADQAATDIAQISNVMGTAGADVDNFGAALVALGNDGASTEAQILGMAQRIAGTGAQIGLAESDILAVANAAASMGLEVEAGGSAISRTFTAIAKATKQGGDDLEAFASIAGVSSKQFVRDFEEDPARAFAAFTAGLNQINESGGDVFTTLDDLGLADVRVSQALLSMAASGDLLTDSLDLGAQAWAENTALAEEAAKRYATTASQTQVAWNKIKDAGIEAGESLLPVIGAIADKVGAAADAFGRLPDPVQSSATELLAIGTITAGATWLGAKTIGAVTSFRSSLRGLEGDATRSSRAMTGLAKAGTALLALEVAGTVLDGLADAATGAAPPVERLTEALLTNIDAQIIAESYKGLGDAIDSLDTDVLDGLGDELQRIGEKGGSIGSALAGGLATMTGMGAQFNQATTDAKALEKGLTSLDAALANIVAVGGADAATAAFDRFAAAQGLTADQQEKLLALLPAYDEALASVANQATLSGEAAEDSAAATDDSADSYRNAANAAQEEADAIREAVAAMREKRSEAIRAANAEINYQASIDDARAALKENGRTLDITTEKGRANRTALLDMAASWNDQSNAVKNSKGAHQEAIGTFVRVATQMGMNAEEARKYANKLFEIPAKRQTDIVLETGSAMGKIAALEAKLNSISDEDVFINVRHRNIGAGDSGFGPQNTGADGTTVPKTGRGYADRHLYLLADGEEVISNRHGQADRFRPLLKAINRLADGGTAMRPASSWIDPFPYAWMQDRRADAAAPDRPFDDLSGKKLREALREMRQTIIDAVQGLDITAQDSAADMRSALKTLEKEITKAGGKWTAAMDAQSDQLLAAARHQERLNAEIANTQAGLDDLNSQRDSVVGATTNALTSDITGGGLAGLTRALTGDRDRAAQLEALTTQLGAAGLDTSGDLFRELASRGDVTTLRQLLASGSAGIDQVEALFSSRGTEVAGFASRVGDLGFGTAIADQTAELARLQADAIEVASDLRTELRQVRREARELIPDKVGKAVGEEINSSAKSASQTQSGKTLSKNPWSA